MAEAQNLVTKVLNWLASHVLAKVIIGLLLAVFAFSTTKINHDELAIRTRFGRNVSKALEPGLHLVFPFMDDVRRYNTTIQFLLITDKSVSSDKTFEEILYKEGVGITTKDNVDAKVVLEVAYAIQKQPEAVDKFVETFGRIESQYGTQKIEKLIADTTRSLTRSILSRVTYRDAESNVIEYSDLVRSLSNNPNAPDKTLPADLSPVIGVAAASLQHPFLSELGIKIQRLGYRIQPSQVFLTSRQNDAVRLETERSRLQILEEQTKADDAEFRNEEQQLKAGLALAAIRKQQFDALPDSDPEKLRLEALKKWDGRLPQTLVLKDDAILLPLFDALKPTSEKTAK